MIDALSIRRSEGGSVLAVGVDRASVVDGERLAVVATAAAVALLPLLVPRGRANISPVDAPITVAMLACLVWAGTSGHRWRFPYAIPMGLLIIGGALGALAGPVPVPGIVALLQDMAKLALDILLIPRFGAIGAAAASAVAYATTTLALVWFFSRVGRSEPVRQLGEKTLASADAH